MKCVLLLVCYAALLPTSGAAAPSVDMPQFIVKPATPALLSEDVLISGKPDGNVREFVSSLSQTAGAPLRFSQITSGREVVVALDADKLANMLAQRLATQRQLTVTHSGTAAAAVLRLTSAVSHTQTLRLLNTAAGDWQLIVQREQTSPNSYQVSIDLAVLGADVLKVLSARADVAYVQPDFQVTAFPK